MKPGKAPSDEVAALWKAARARLSAYPLAASALGPATFLLACGGLYAFSTSAAAPLLFAPSIALEAATAGATAAFTTTALALIAGGQISVSGPAAPLWTALVCAIATGQIGLVNGLAQALARRARALEDARQVVATQDVFFAETQHRVGNNLSVICSALSLQARRSSDSATKRALEEASERVRLIAEVNRMLTTSPTADLGLDAAFIERLVSKSIAAYGAQARVRFSVFVEPVDVPPESILPVALVLGECVNNALEHGFAGEASGSIKIRLETMSGDSGRRRLIVWDDGAGVAAGFAAGAGLTLVRAFARSLGGEFQLESDGRGARSTFTF